MIGRSGVKGTTRIPTEPSNLGSYVLKEIELIIISVPYGTDLGPQHICYSCASLSLCGTPSSENKGCLIVLAYFGTHSSCWIAHET